MLFLARREGDAGSSEHCDCTERFSPRLPWGYWEETPVPLSALVPPGAPLAAVSVVCLCVSGLLAGRQGRFKACGVLGPPFLPSNGLLLAVLLLPASALEDSI